MVDRVILNKQPAPLASRISAMLENPNSGSQEIGELIAETEQAITDADAMVLRERAKAIDISASPDAEAAQDAMARAHAAGFNRDRLQSAMPRLRDKLTSALEGERHSRWLAEYRRVVAERDALADEFAESYSRLASELVDLFARMVACDRRCAEINSSASALQNEHRRLLKPELRARGLDAFSRDRPEITKVIALPEFVESQRMIWPPKQPSMAAEFAASSMGSIPHPGQHWADPDIVARRRADAAREQKHLADFYTEQSEAQERRENLEARERFAQTQRRT